MSERFVPQPTQFFSGHIAPATINDMLVALSGIFVLKSIHGNINGPAGAAIGIRVNGFDFHIFTVPAGAGNLSFDFICYDVFVGGQTLGYDVNGLAVDAVLMLSGDYYSF